MTTMITSHGYNDLVYHAHNTIVEHYTRKNMVIHMISGCFKCIEGLRYE